ncbi:acid phosphatase PHOa [Penicillium nucicola]|uniref:acid phosphatase PHOa n=1 Tax=Penicillium nucicola TaxID=1850975 RepID=UPI002545076F|nr:acid phosphatase PHOa [Penicillium nucicola]KAJ5767152.1 acid phosphatase PHOa [Penicillium nucicola]
MMTCLLILSTFGALSTAASVASRDSGISKKYVAPRASTSNVPGVYFDRFYQIWLENIDYTDGANNSDLKWLATMGITLTNYFATGHTSEPNYCAAASGDSYGMDNDNFHQIPSNVSTVVDLLNTKGISWAEYQEDIPATGFQGESFSNQQKELAYVRKHNPLVLFDKITNNATALELIKGFSSFEDDLKARTLPQWAFFTPNMTNDGHDTSLAYGAKWARGFISGLMDNEYFWNNTLMLLTFDETETYTVPNRVFSILIGGAIPKDLVGTSDHTMYTHYSTISTVSANWGLPSLGRWDCGANIFGPVADKVNYTNWKVDTTNLYLNESLPGPLEALGYSKFRSTWPVPSTNESCSANNGILQSVIDTYKGREPTYNYTAPFAYDTSANLNLGVTYSRSGTTYMSGVNTTGAIAQGSSTVSSKSTNAAVKTLGLGSSLAGTGSCFSLAVALSAFIFCT